MKIRESICAAGLVLIFAGSALAAVPQEEINQLGTTLTLIGAEKAGNKDGSIPPYTGGLTTPPPNFKKGSGIRPDPFASEKPLFSINAKNMAQYADKLSEGVKALMKKYPDYRVDVYKTHRTVAFPQFVYDNTIKCAAKATLSADGLNISNADACYPFPIPKSGAEAMRNHLLRYLTTEHAISETYSVNANGRATLSTIADIQIEYPYWDPKAKDKTYFQMIHSLFTDPPRRNGEIYLVKTALNNAKDQNMVHMYLPGQRRVKLAPDNAYDTPEPSSNGATTFDDLQIYNGAMDRYNWKLLGKKEMYVPYNTYKLSYESTAKELFKEHFINPEYVRWELHRVWVVEATLKPGKRHIYPRRVFYLDEDSWTALANDEYDARGQIYRTGLAYLTQSYDVLAPVSDPYGYYDLITGQYTLGFYTAQTGGKKLNAPKYPQRSWTPDSLAGSGVR